MKYIRTKESIYETIEYNIKDNIYYIKSIDTRIGNKFGIYKSAVIKQADTIEELCDAFVGILSKDYHLDFENYLWSFDKIKEFIKTNKVDEIYGAIWTDKGLIYVAKMNDKGELELL